MPKICCQRLRLCGPGLLRRTNTSKQAADWMGTVEMQAMLMDFASDLFIPLPQCKRIERIIEYFCLNVKVHTV